MCFSSLSILKYENNWLIKLNNLENEEIDEKSSESVKERQMNDESLM